MRIGWPRNHGGKSALNDVTPDFLPDRSHVLSPGGEWSFEFGERRFEIRRPSPGRAEIEVFPRDPEETHEPPEPCERVVVATAAKKDFELDCRLNGAVVPILVKLKDELTILPGDQALFVASAPLHLTLSSTSSSDHPLLDIPCRWLSRAWAGSNLTGEPALEWESPVWWESPEPGDERPPLDVAYCPLTVKNGGGGPLKLSKLSLRLEHCPLFALDGRLWTGRIRIVYTGAQEGADLRYQSQAPREAKDARPVYPARSPQRRPLTARTIGHLLGSDFRVTS